MLDQYISECMVSIININNGIEEHGYQNCNTSQILIFGGYVKAREFFLCPSYYLDQYHSKPH